MIVRARAPLRLGLAGGGTDVSPYADLYGGAILNSTISLNVYASLIPTTDGKIRFNSIDLGKSQTFDALSELPTDHPLGLFAGTYNRVVKDFCEGEAFSFEMTTYVDVPKGSGLGTSSTICVAILGAFVEYLQLGLGEYDIAHLAYEIERKDLMMAGGRQDQYAATFGGVNYMEFGKDESVIVNPLRIKSEYLSELEHNLLLYYTGRTRVSSQIIERQRKAFNDSHSSSIEAAHHLKEQSIEMKKALLTGKIDEIGNILHQGWVEKKKMAKGISNQEIEDIYQAARNAGASGGKISGAGGGGYMMIYCPETSRYRVMEALKNFNGYFQSYKFEKIGMTSWKR